MTPHINGGRVTIHSDQHIQRHLTIVAMWQFAAFLMLLLMVWVNESLGITSLVFGSEPSPPDYLGCSVVTACILLTAVVTVGHTYDMQKNIISGLITICSCCHKVKVDQDRWKGIDSYVTDHSLATFSHGLCPECLEENIEALDREIVSPHAAEVPSAVPAVATS